METLQGLLIICVLAISGLVATIEGSEVLTKGIKENSALVTLYGLVVMLAGCSIIGTGL